MAKILQNNYVLAEKYLGGKYSFRYNEVSNEIEYKEKKDDEYKPLNENALFRELMHSN
jgi:hypothetical protein